MKKLLTMLLTILLTLTLFTMTGCVKGSKTKLPVITQDKVESIRAYIQDARNWVAKGETLALAYKNQGLLTEETYTVTNDILAGIRQGIDSGLEATKDLKSFDPVNRDDWIKAFSTVFTGVEDFNARASPLITKGIQALIDRGVIKGKTAEDIQTKVTLYLTMFSLAFDTFKNHLPKQNPVENQQPEYAQMPYSRVSLAFVL